jgi:hypothetical protein
VAYARAGGVVQGVDSEFKPQHCKKIKVQSQKGGKKKKEKERIIK